MAVAIPFQGKFEREVKKMTIDEIREKYHCDKRQTGQVALNPLEKGGIDFRKAEPNNPVLPGLKRAVRAKGFKVY